MKGKIKMKKLIFISCLILFVSAKFYTQEMPIIKEMELLEPFMGKTWLSEMASGAGVGTLHTIHKYESMHNGKIVKYHNENIELKQQSDGYYYYDPVKKEIAFLIINTNGNYRIGNVKKKGGQILMYGYATIRGERIEFRNIYEIISNGEIIDKWYSLEEGEWKAGHVATWKAK